MDNQTTLAGVATESSPLFALTVQWDKDACELDEAGSKALHRLERAAYRGAAERVRNMAARLRMEIQANDAAQARVVASRGEADCSADDLLADLRRARTDMDNAFHKFPEDHSSPASLFTNWIRAIHAIDATIAKMETLTANAALTGGEAVDPPAPPGPAGQHRLDVCASREAWIARLRETGVLRSAPDQARNNKRSTT
jgi:hypothetical protein